MPSCLEMVSTYAAIYEFYVGTSSLSNLFTLESVKLNPQPVGYPICRQ